MRAKLKTNIEDYFQKIQDLQELEDNIWKATVKYRDETESFKVQKTMNGWINDIVEKKPKKLNRTIREASDELKSRIDIVIRARGE